MGWENLDLAAGLLQNANETALKGQAAEFENAFLTRAKSWSRFPGLRQLCTTSQGRNYLFPYKGNLMAATSGGRFHRINDQGAATDVTEFAIQGGRRTVFAETDDGLLMAAGGPIARYQGSTTHRLSEEAPDATHVAALSGYVIAIAPRSGQFQNTAVGQYTLWNPLDTFSAEGQPDQLNALLVNDAGQLLASGPKSIETYEPSAGGAVPFFRRSVANTGVHAPYTLCAHETGSYAITQRLEAATVGSGAETKSEAIQLALNAVENWTDAWAQVIQISGHDFLIIQAPRAATPYETEGMTFAYDVRLGRWFFLYGWDTDLGRPARWPGWSVATIWGRTFVGGEGVVYEMSKDYLTNAGQPLRPLWRSGHMEGSGGRLRVDDFRIRALRGQGAVGADVDPMMSLRVNRDNEGFGHYIRIGLGNPSSRTLVKKLGPLGIMDTFQIELMMTDDAAFEVSGLAMDVTVLAG